LEDFVHMRGGALPEVRHTWPIGHEAPHLGQSLRPENRREPVLAREGGDSAEVLRKERGG